MAFTLGPIGLSVAILFIAAMIPKSRESYLDAAVANGTAADRTIIGTPYTPANMTLIYIVCGVGGVALLYVGYKAVSK